MAGHSDHAAWRSKPFLTGLTFLLIGAGALWVDSHYKTGTATNMQPGFFPGLLAILLILLGAGSIFTAFRAEAPEPVVAPSLAPLLRLLLGMTVFALLLDPLGLVPAVIALVLIICADRLRRNWGEVLLIAAALAALSTGIFVYALKLPLTAF